MSTLDISISTRPSRAESQGVRLHRFTVNEYHRMREFGVFKKDDPIELLDGHLYVKLDHGPPYGVPLGIPPEVIAGSGVEPFPQRRFTVDEYHKLMDSAALDSALRTELVEGWVVEKMTRNALHDSTLQYAPHGLRQRIGSGWDLRSQSAVTMDDGEPEPDIVVVPGPPLRFRHEHPVPSDVGLLIEISDTTLRYNRGPKLRDYARNSVARYWILNTNDRVVEVFEDPTGPTELPDYRIRKIYKLGESVPLLLRDDVMESVPVDELIPPD